MTVATAVDVRRREARRRHATAAMVGVLVYIAVDVVLRFLPPHYSVIHEAESNLAVGPFGWIMALNFLGRAATTLFLVAAIGRSGPATRLRQTGMVLLAAGAASSAVLPFFPTDVGPGSEMGSGSHTSTGLIHLWIAGLGFLAALAAVIVLTMWLRRSPPMARAVPGALFFAALASLGLLWLGISGGFMVGLLGLAERLCLAGILGWAFVVGLAIRRQAR
ncbi:DUF998 domain-containing protein [Arthrobacter sp. 35W]|uniref:DUF998 domain-containing protein n=1 Tax=Arthrobacter sp. 35W TaxID=1132441 RepID=UPI0004080F13|nr:DUF998 domain-containing protein [Arthrobacter sp. 35W]